MRFEVGKLYEFLESERPAFLDGPNHTKIPWDINHGTVIMVLEKDSSPENPNHIKILTADGTVGWGWLTPGLWKLLEHNHQGP